MNSEFIGDGIILNDTFQTQKTALATIAADSHIAFGSIRMEPVFFALGQVAATAAAQAIDAGCAVQDVPYDRLSARLLADGQVISKP